MSSRKPSSASMGSFHRLVLMGMVVNTPGKQV
jgi:hypothetical protein